ncbi:LLM class flavin-dependent oxidoreductase [Galbitalea sp. SE-J8]|uniref:LLM class flavin-dependent oxidoreductase n=1 Tax=Galbitalea sp. SE-J8 TaxID=3054952 RepID=UPI00259C9D8E|nr:LLM class flavin-dependent oxidoreductase [Galbitalea sp. SE-J8]MDM4761607.1 LLM class flavin-dependent oxidoreductase [Galbitalea sp. SE-J8]
MTAPFRLGFLTHAHGTAEVTARELYPALVDLFVAADELGFDSGWVSQHHLQTLQGRLPSPLVLLAAAAARTRRIRLGTAVVVLPLEHPVRVAEDLAVLDALAGDRVELGLGSGGPSLEQFAAFDRDPDRRRELYAQHRDRLESALRGDVLPGGALLQPDAPTLVDRVWETPVRAEAAWAAGAAGRGILLGLGPARGVQEQLAAEHAAGWATSSRAAERPRAAAVRGAFPDVSREAAAARLAPDVARHLDYHVEYGWLGPDAGLTELLDALNVQYGRPDDIVASLSADPVLPSSTDLVLAVQAESTTVTTAIAALETIATEIAPALGWSPAP